MMRLKKLTSIFTALLLIASTIIVPSTFKVNAEYNKTTLLDLDMEVDDVTEIASSVTGWGSVGKDYVNIAANQGVNGSKAMDFPLCGNARAAAFNGVTLKANTYYTVTYSYKADADNLSPGQAYFFIGKNKDNHIKIDNAYKENIYGTESPGLTDVTSEYQTKSFTFKATETAIGKGSKFGFVVYKASGDNHLYLDNLKLEEVPAVTVNINCGGNRDNMVVGGNVNEAITLPTPEEMKLDGYKFEGFYTTSDFQEESKLSGSTYTQSTAGVYTIYARYIPTTLLDLDMEVDKASDIVTGVNNWGSIGSAETNIRIVASEGKDNTNALAFPMKAANGVTFNNVTLKANSYYTVTYSYKADTTLTSSGVACFFIGKDKTNHTKIREADYKNYIYGAETADALDVSDTYKTKSFTFKATETAIEKGTKFGFVVYKGSGNNQFYLDNVILEEAVPVTLVKNNGDANETVYGVSGDTMTVTTPAKFGYTFAGWCSDPELNNIVELPSAFPDSSATYYAKWNRLEAYKADFSNGLDDNLIYHENTPELITSGEEKYIGIEGTGISSYPLYNIILPIELEAGVQYTVSYRYSTNDDNNFQLNPDNNRTIIGYTDTTHTTSTKINDYANILRDTDSTNDKWNLNKVYKTDGWVKRTFSFTADEAMKNNFVTLDIGVYQRAADLYLYLDDISILKTPTATFMSEGAELTDNKVTAAPDTVIDIPKIPNKAGHRFIGWFVGDENKGMDTVVMPETDTTFEARFEKLMAIGDLTGNNIIDAEDLIILCKVLLGINNNYDIGVADANGSGTLEVADIVRLKKYVADSVNVTLGKTVNDKSSLQLVWAEEFDGQNHKFNTTPFQGNNNPDSIEFSTADDVLYVKDGVMNIKSINNGGKIKTASGIETQDTMNFKYGYIEINADVPCLGIGEWPALWYVSSAANLAGEQRVNNLGFEVDQAENMGGGTLQSALHIWDNVGSNNDGDILNLPAVLKFQEDYKEKTGYHLYGMYWDEDGFIFYIDNVKVAEYTIADIKEKLSDKNIPNNIFDQFITLRIGMNYAEFGDKYTLENALANIDNAKISIDYVRLYQNINTDSIITR